MIEPKIVIFLIYWLLPATTILARQWLNGRHVVLPTKGTSKKNNNNNKQTKQNKNTQPELVDTWARDTVMRYW